MCHSEKFQNFTAEFLMQIFEKFDSLLVDSGSLPVDECRCSKKDKGNRRCMREKNHDGKCNFIPKGSMS